MNILSYYDIIVNIRASLPFMMYKASYFFDFLINTPFFIKLKRDPSGYKKDPLDLPIYKITICKINKISYNKHKNL